MKHLFLLSLFLIVASAGLSGCTPKSTAPQELLAKAQELSYEQFARQWMPPVSQVPQIGRPSEDRSNKDTWSDNYFLGGLTGPSPEVYLANVVNTFKEFCHRKQGKVIEMPLLNMRGYVCSAGDNDHIGAIVVEQGSKDQYGLTRVTVGHLSGPAVTRVFPQEERKASERVAAVQQRVNEGLSLEARLLNDIIQDDPLGKVKTFLYANPCILRVESKELQQQREGGRTTFSLTSGNVTSIQLMALKSELLENAAVTYSSMTGTLYRLTLADKLGNQTELAFERQDVAGRVSRAIRSLGEKCGAR